MKLTESSLASIERTLRWSATPLFAPIVSYDISVRRIAGDGTVDPHIERKTFPNSATEQVVGMPGYEYCYQLVARDAEGGSGTTSTCTQYPFDDRALTRSPEWTELGDPGYYLATALRATTRGATLTLPNVQGMGSVTLVATTCPSCGKVRVRLDFDGSIDDYVIDLFSSERIDRKIISIVYDHEAEVEQNIKVSLKVLSTGNPVIIDGLYGGHPEWP